MALNNLHECACVTLGVDVLARVREVQYRKMIAFVYGYINRNRNTIRNLYLAFETGLCVAELFLRKCFTM